MSTPPYGSPPPPSGMPGASPVNATMILVLGILSFFCFGIITGPIAWIMGNNALQTLNQTGDPTNVRGTVSAGRICGMIGTVLSILGIIYGVFMGGFAALSARHAGSTVPFLW